MDFTRVVLLTLVWWNTIHAGQREKDKQSGIIFRKGYGSIKSKRWKDKLVSRLRETYVVDSHEAPGNNETDLTLDYDVIEVLQTTSALSKEEMGFSTIKGQTCPGSCVRGISGLCICPPLIIPPTPSKTNDTVASQPLAGQVGSRRSDLPVPGQKSALNNSIPQRRRTKRDEEDDDEQKLCKCRRCTKLFKRTLYCRVFPCYKKKCKSGEWRE